MKKIGNLAEALLIKESCFSHPVVIVDFGQVTIAAVWKNEEDFLAFQSSFLTLDPFISSDDGSTARNSGINSFFRQKISGHQKGFFVFDLDHVVDYVEVII